MKKNDFIFTKKVSIKSLFTDTPDQFRRNYGGDLIALTMQNGDAEDLFRKFRDIISEAIGHRYLPVYRMADGEFHFILGNVYKFNSHQSLKLSLYSFMYHIKQLIFGPLVTTAWGEVYDKKEIINLRTDFRKKLAQLLENGILCAYLYNNPLNTYTQYNQKFIQFLQKNNFSISITNFFPFHFPMLALSNPGWEIFIQKRNILVITGNLVSKRQTIKNTLLNLGASKVGFYEISPNKSLKDVLNQQDIEDNEEFNIAFVAAGIGALNIIAQMEWFRGPVIDIGGYINVLLNDQYVYHGGAVKYPGSRMSLV